jgi:hypothetical protein
MQEFAVSSNKIKMVFKLQVESSDTIFKMEITATTMDFPKKPLSLL